MPLLQCASAGSSRGVFDWSQSCTAVAHHVPDMIDTRSPVSVQSCLLMLIMQTMLGHVLPSMYCRYRTLVEDVPAGDYTLPLGQAAVVKEGSDITLVGWGAQVR